MKEALFWKPADGKAACMLCARKCVIPEGGTGFCRVRQNVSGNLMSLVYGKVASLAVDPIQKKPFFHFAPGSETLSLSTVGCNFRCKFCCNYQLSQEWKEIFGEEHTPESIARLAKRQAVQGMCYTYIEPTVFYEFAVDCARLATKQGLYNCWVTNGYTMPEPILSFKGLDAAVIDLKGSGNAKVYRELASVPSPEPIFEALLAYKKAKTFIEITDLIIPGQADPLKDVKKLSSWVFDNLGPDIPLHFIRFFPSYKLQLPSPDIALLEKACETARKEGMNYVYLGNVPGHRWESTYCPGCNELAIERKGIFVARFLLGKDMKCRKCGRKLPIGGAKWIPKQFFKKA